MSHRHLTPDAAGSAGGFQYIGDELDVFARAVRWKSYLRSHVRPYLGDRVLEVGAGIGGTTHLLCEGDHQAWICLEPDGRFAERLRAQLAAGGLRECCSVRTGTIHDLRPDERFDSVLYVDVLEHIERDREELARAAEHVAPGGALVVLVPARPGLFSAFDRALGHFRRYTAESLRAVAPPALAEAKMIYLDSVGCLASLANRFILKESRPGRWQVWTWDRLMVPVSRVVDPLLGHAVGKSLLGVWRRTA